MTVNRTMKILWIAIILYIAFFGIFASFRHYNFQTQTWDLAVFVQTFWNTVHGRIMQNSLEEIPNHLAVHMRPLMFLLVPGYALFPSPYYLLIVQTIVLGLGSLPLYLIAKKILNPKLALIAAIGFLLSPQLHWINAFDFHEIAFFPTLILFAFYFFEEKKWKLAGLFFALAAAVKEDAAIVVVFAGIYLFLRPPFDMPRWNTERKIGLAIAALALIYFILSVKVIMPALGGGLLRLDRYANLGNTPGEIVKNIVSRPNIIPETIFQPEKLRYLLWLFLPVAFLPLFYLPGFILLAPGLAENLLTSFAYQFQSFYHYDAVILPGLFIGTIYGIRRLLLTMPRLNRAIPFALAAAFITGYVVRSPVNPVFFPLKLFRSDPHWTAMRQIAKQVPPNASVAAPTNLVPHLANREQVYMLGREPFPPDMIIIDTYDSFGFPDVESFENYIKGYLDSDLYTTSLMNSRYLIFINRQSLVDTF